MQRLVAKYVQDSVDVAGLRKQLQRTGEVPSQYGTLKNRLDKLEAELGLTPIGLLKNRWEIAADEVGERRDERATPAPAAASAGARRRLTVAGESSD